MDAGVGSYLLFFSVLYARYQFRERGTREKVGVPRSSARIAMLGWLRPWSRCVINKPRHHCRGLMLLPK